MGNKKKAFDAEELIEEVRESFDLGDFLRGRSVRTKTVRVFTDEVTAEKRGGYEQTTRRIQGVEVPHVRSWGLVKEIAEATDAAEKLDGRSAEGKAAKKRLAELHKEAEALTEKLLETALEIELRAIPEVIKKDAFRAAKKSLGIKGKIGEGQGVEFIDEQNAQMLVRTVVSITKHDTDERNEGVTIDDARNLVNLLPKSEWDKIDEALNQLLFEKVISDQVVEDPDF